MKRILIILTLVFVAHGVTRAQKSEPELQGYLAPNGSFVSVEAAGGFQQTLIAKYLQMYSSAPTCSRVGQLYYDTTLHKARTCTATPSTWETILSGTSAAAPIDATYITQTANSTLTNEQAMASLGTGIVKNTTTTGVQSIITPGTGVETALGVNIGSAGAFITFNGNAGTPSALVCTNCSGTAASLTAGAVTGFTAGAGVLSGPSSAGVASTLGNNETITGIKTYSPTARSSGTAAYYTLNVPADTGQTAATESIGVNFVTATRTWADGTVALQRERFFAGVTYNKTTTNATFTDIFNTAYTQPVAGSGVTFTRPHTVGILDSTSATSSITGGLIVATTYGTTATSVGIGGGNVNAGGNGTFGGTLNVTGIFTASAQQTIGVGATSSALTDLLINPTTKASGNLIDLQVNSVSQFKVAFGGATTIAGALTYGGVTLTNAVTGTGKMVLDTTPTVQGIVILKADASAFALDLVGRNNGGTDEGQIRFFANNGTTTFGSILSKATSLSLRDSAATQQITISTAGTQIGPSGTAITKHLSNTATLDFANLAAIGCEDLTITVTGAALGDSVGIGVPNASIVANGNFFGWVSSADTVSIRFCTVVSGNPASGTFRADVWQH